MLPVPREGERSLGQKELGFLRLRSPSQGTLSTLWFCQKSDSSLILSPSHHLQARPGHPPSLHPTCRRPRRPGSAVTVLGRQKTQMCSQPWEDTSSHWDHRDLHPQIPALLWACTRDLRESFQDYDREGMNLPCLTPCSPVLQSPRPPFLHLHQLFYTLLPFLER